MAQRLDRYGRAKVCVKMCSSATCEGSEIGCGRGDCLSSKHHASNAYWRWWTIDRFIKIFDRLPHGFTEQDLIKKNKNAKDI